MTAPAAPPWLSQLRDEVRMRLRAGRVTQASLAARLGISEKHMSQILTGYVTPGPGLIDRIATAMGLRIVIVIEGEPVPLERDQRGRRPAGAAISEEETCRLT